MEKKYELTDITKKIIGDSIEFFKETTVYRIRALKDFDSVKKGELGGWIESEDNLSHNGTCWIFSDAMVYGNAKVFDNATVYGNSCVHGNARVFDSACISDYTRVYNRAIVHGNAKVYGGAKVCEHAVISGDAYIGGTSMISSCVIVNGYASVNDSYVKGDAIIRGSSRINGATVGNNANINNTSDYLVIGPIGSRNDKTTFYKGINDIYVHTGCFEGTLKQFEDAVNETHKDNEKYRNQYLAMINYVKDNLMEDN